VLCYQRDRIPDALKLVIQATQDSHPRVQLEALRALSFFNGADTKPALEAALRFKDSTDQYLAYCFRDVVQQLTYLPEGQGLVDLKTLIKAPAVSYGPTNKKLSKAENAAYQTGKEIFSREGMCATCHQPDGQGADMPAEKGKPLRGAYPSLVDSDWLKGDATRAIKIVLNGLYGPMTLNGKSYGDVASGQPAMTPLGQMLKDEEVAAVLTYVRQSWKNNQPPVTADQVKQVRESIKSKQPSIYTPEEVLKEHPLAK
jgi:mono/diheme cytochrome c family protein